LLNDGILPLHYVFGGWHEARGGGGFGGGHDHGR
jgi:hypothetical protein